MTCVIKVGSTSLNRRELNLFLSRPGLISKMLRQDRPVNHMKQYPKSGIFQVQILILINV